MIISSSLNSTQLVLKLRLVDTLLNFIKVVMISRNNKILVIKLFIRKKTKFHILDILL
jgi:hypothetical protein